MAPRIEVLEIGPSRKSTALASAKVRLTVGDVEIIVADLRILQSKSGNLWVGRPSFATPSSDRKAFSYTDVVEFDQETQRAVENAVLEAYEQQDGGRR
jgi:DNA-binding cell septation regulator SpoVG